MAEFLRPLEPGESVIPDGDMTDVGQGHMLARLYNDKLRYHVSSNRSGRWLVYDGKKWNASDILARDLSIRLTDLQKQELDHRVDLIFAEQRQKKITDDKILATELAPINALKKEISKRRQDNRVEAALKVAAPKLMVKTEQLDANPFYLNTPDGTIDLRTGQMHPHCGADLCTMMTAVSPDTDGQEEMISFLNRITGGREDVIECLQVIAGMCLVGRVYAEKMIFLFGPGGNGKTTFMRVLEYIMGDYASTLDSTVLTDSTYTNRFALSGVRGKRLIAMGELKPDVRLNRSMLIRLSSSAKMPTEDKFAARYEFDPSHTMMVETNDLPEVRQNDIAIWDRMIIIPFNERLRGQADTKYDMADYLNSHCGPAFLAWAIAGAQKYIGDNYQIKMPESSLTVLREYMDNCNMIVRFVRDCCDQDESASTASKDFLNAFRTYAGAFPIYTDAAIRAQVEALGYTYHRTKKGVSIVGLKLLV